MNQVERNVSDPEVVQKGVKTGNKFRWKGSSLYNYLFTANLLNYSRKQSNEHETLSTLDMSQMMRVGLA